MITYVADPKNEEIKALNKYIYANN